MKFRARHSKPADSPIRHPPAPQPSRYLSQGQPIAAPCPKPGEVLNSAELRDNSRAETVTAPPEAAQPGEGSSHPLAFPQTLLYCPGRAETGEQPGASPNANAAGQQAPHSSPPLSEDSSPSPGPSNAVWG